MSQAQPEVGAVQYKSMRLFIKYNLADLALKSATNLVQYSPGYIKAQRGLKIFDDYRKSAQFTKPEDVQAFDSLLKSFKPIELNKLDMHHAHELLKTSAANSAVALPALQGDALSISRVY